MISASIGEPSFGVSDVPYILIKKSPIQARPFRNSQAQALSRPFYFLPGRPFPGKFFYKASFLREIRSFVNDNSTIIVQAWF